MPEKFRFAVGSAERIVSSHWFVSVRQNCVYFGAKPLGNTLKASFHTSGASHVRFGDAAYLESIAGQRVVAWQRRAIPDVGILHVATVVFPTDLLRGNTETPVRSNTTVIEPAPLGHAVEVGLFYTKESGSELEKRLAGIALPIFLAQLANGERLLVTLRTLPFDPTMVGPIGGLVGGTAKAILPRPLWERPNMDQASMRGVSGVWWNDPRETGVLVVVNVTGLRLVAPQRE